MFVDLTINLIVLRLLALLIVAPAQRVTFAATAVILGDAGPKHDGDLRVDPLRHLDPFGSLSTVVFGIGWSRLVTVDAAQFKVGRAGAALVVAASFAALVLTAFVLHRLVTPAVTMLPFSAGIAVSGFLGVAAQVSLWFALLGLIPIPPLTGGLLLTAFGIRLPARAQWVLAAALFAAVATGLVGGLLGPAHASLTSLVLGR